MYELPFALSLAHHKHSISEWLADVERQRVLREWQTPDKCSRDKQWASGRPAHVV